MEPREAALLSSILHLPTGITITSVHPSATELVVRIACHAPSMPCPGCHQLSARIHGSYQRTVADLPCAGRNVFLMLTVRKFVCSTPTCPHKIFTERLPGLVQSYARMTTRLIALVPFLGLVAGGQMGTRLADRLGIATASSTLLRHLMQLPAPVGRAVRVLGIDDFAWKKRFTYGTILVDLERRKIIDVLADRESATVAAWLQEHPEVELVIRDRGKDFTKAATVGAPQAQQVVDRFHVVKNLSEVLQEILGHCRAEIRQGEAPLAELEKAPEARARVLPTVAAWQQRTPTHVKKVHQARQASRDDRYQQMTTLRAQGWTQREVAKRMGMSERAVRHWLKRGAAPSNERQFRRRSIFDPYAAYVLQRGQDGIHEAKQLYEEIQAQGFSGTVRIVQRFVQALRDDPEKITLAPATGADRFSSKTTTWLFIRDPKQLTTTKQAELELICQRSETARKTYELTQQFMSMLRLRRGQDFETWLSAVETSHIPELYRFAQGLLKDKDAVVAGLTLSYSNGPVEAQVHKLKLVKRSMYGRAKLPLLRHRLLHAA
ncbi:MAG TPA: ISL3 family transposase [Ktedonobacteraceae bacterium]